MPSSIVFSEVRDLSSDPTEREVPTQDPHLWVSARVRAANTNSHWRSDDQETLLPLARESDLTPAEIKFVARSAEAMLGNTLFDEYPHVHRALASRPDLTVETAQFIIDSAARGASWRKTCAMVEETIVRNDACRRFLGQLNFHALS